jgi:hypothetical protein
MYDLSLSFSLSLSLYLSIYLSISIYTYNIYDGMMTFGFYNHSKENSHNGKLFISLWNKV